MGIKERLKVSSQFVAEHEESGAELPNTLLALFLWLTLILLSGLGNVSTLQAAELSIFSSVGVAVLSLAALLCAFLNTRGGNLNPVLFTTYSVLVLLPAVVIAPSTVDRSILLDLYFVLLVTAPSFLNLWSWRLQTIASALALFAVSVMWVPVGSWVALSSIVLVGLSGLLSTAVVLLRSRDAVIESAELTKRGLSLLAEASKKRLLSFVWNVLLLQAGLFLVLIFLDVAFWGERVPSTLIAKIYGLILLVFGSLVLRAANARYVESCMAVLTVLLGVSLSFARSGYGELPGVSAVLPLVYLAFVVTVLPWSLTTHIAVAWLLLLQDFFVKVLTSGQLGGGISDLLTVPLVQYRGETALLCIGTTASVLVARSLQFRRVRNLSEFHALAEQEDDAPADAANDPSSEEPTPLSFSSHEALGPERRQRMIAGLLIVGILSCIVSSRLLFSLSATYWGAAIAAWVTFFVLWAALIFLDRRPAPSEYFWMLGAFVELVLFLWPCILLLVVSDAGSFWLFWPLCVLLGIGTIPWRMQELVPLLLVSVIAGAELVFQLNLGGISIAIFSFAALLGMLCSAKGTRSLKEKHFLLHLSSRLELCKEEKDALRLLTDYLMNLFDTGSALCSAGPDHLELVRGGMSFPLNPNSWPVAAARSFFRPVSPKGKYVTLKAANWLPTRMSFFDRRFGVFTASHGFLVEIEIPKESSTPRFVGEDDQAVTQAVEVEQRRYSIFLPMRFPLVEMMRESELKVASSLSGITRLRLARFSFEAAHERLQQDHSLQMQEREYELGALVHDINNTVQDLTLLCDSILEDSVEKDEEEEKNDTVADVLIEQVRRISFIARSVATIVSDAKRKRELERLDDLRPRELVEVIQVVREIVSFATLRAERKRISVEEPKLPEEKIWVRVSIQEHLETILRNLFNNAISYSDPGSFIRLDFTYDQQNVWIEVVDNGPGLTQEECESVFQAGFRGSSGLGRPGGLGLGLSQSRRVAESANGTLTVRSEGPGQGCTFTLQLPRKVAPTPHKVQEPWALVVDDQPAITDFYSKLVGSMQYKPGTASSVAEAMDVVRDLGKPAFVITDIHLGSSNGLDLVRELRTEFGVSLPILVVSGLPDDDVAQQAKIAGATDFVAKPVRRRSLLARIQSLLPVG